MAAISSGVARPAVSSITETRYCILDHLLWSGRSSWAAAHTYYERLRPDPTPPPGFLVEPRISALAMPVASGSQGSATALRRAVRRPRRAYRMHLRVRTTTGTTSELADVR